ncbi:hypothetical protein NIES37_02060 [Tolypothrix tenuis PCC 7101]|uniref:Uncharacterized protein n=1 Tax=Tolypothrix tenuis PCC 7101 TaxID=231146 RepID=A0A1Z4MS18_9CYAN|nr:hypothetical protein [Aulosira sp. FACHB-113]BAY96276.1 hypothetical protein NIES37_02060 [Tolypothrix tenuis PCC 7101]BAZ73217.1 hypothetical protein NIES50_17780 [Aulosira laxa NIES-50]
MNLDFLSLQLMNRFASLIIAASIASIATLAIAQNTDARTCTLYRTCYYQTSNTSKSVVEYDADKNLYKSGMLSIFIVLAVTKIANNALESWLNKA